MSAYHCSWPSSIVSVPPSSPCGPINATTPVVPCCAHGDFCLSYNICAYNSHSDGGGSGYYSAGCSNGSVLDTGSSSVCANRCADTGLPDITYDSLDGSWKCCGGNYNERNCQLPTNESFNAPAPSDLITYWVAGSTASSAPPASMTESSTMPTLAVTTPAVNTTTAATPNTETQVSDTGHSSTLSVGAKIGIGAGVGMSCLTLLAVISMLFHSRRQRTINNQSMAQTVRYPVSTPDKLHELSTQADKPRKLPFQARKPQELPSGVGSSVHELY